MSHEPDPQILSRLVDEIRRAPRMVLEEAGESDRIFSVVAMLQLALRHPRADDTGATPSTHARLFIAEVERFYRDYPTIVQVIRMGFDS